MKTLPSKRWVDAHCHLSDPRVELEPVLAECRSAGIERFVLGGVDPEDWERQVALDKAHPSTFVKVFGLHPWRVDDLVRDAIERQAPPREALRPLLELLESKVSLASAVGETGLDAARDRFKRSRAEQVECFVTQIELAARIEKPLVLHVVRAHGDALRILAERKASVNTGLVHSFSGTWQDGRRYLDLGLTLSVSARVTHPDAADLRETVLKAPADRLVFETDAPDQPPYSPPGEARGTTNTPLSLLKVVEKVSEIRSESPETLLNRSRDLLSDLFGFSR